MKYLLILMLVSSIYADTKEYGPLGPIKKPLEPIQKGYKWNLKHTN